MTTDKTEIFRIFLELAFDLGDVISKDIRRKLKYKKIIKRILVKLNFDYAEVWFRSSKSGYLEKANISVMKNDSFKGLDSINREHIIKYGEDILGVAWEKKSPVWIKNIQENQNFSRRKIAKEYDLKTAITMPVFAFDYLDAVCVFFSTKDLVYEEIFLDLLEHIANDMGANLIINEIKKEIRQNAFNTKQSNITHLRTVNKIFQLKDSYTILHQEEVVKISQQIGKKLNLSQKKLDALYLGALFHDIGKIEIPQEILSKPTVLNNEEYNLIKRHPQTAYDILSDSLLTENVKRIILEHHERNDGSGYPNQLQKENISYLAKIVAVADIISAMKSHRPYRAAFPLKDVIKELKNQSGKQLEEEIVSCSIKILKKKK